MACSENRLVKIRKQGSAYFAYFVELRRIVVVNQIGAKIIEWFFNHKYAIGKMLDLAKKDNYVLSNKDVADFLREIRSQITLPYEGGHPFLEEEQLDVPISVELQICRYCNLRCKHCAQSNYEGDMPIERVRHMLEILDRDGVFEINLTGGEPFLYPHILEVISLCCEKHSFATNIVTNGTCFDKLSIKELSRFRSKLALLISLEGVGEINDKIRGKGVFRKVDKVIRALKSHGLYVEINSTVSAHNIDHYKALIDYAKSLNVPCNFNLFKPCKEKHHSGALDPFRYFSFVEELFRLREYGVDVGLPSAAILAELTGTTRNECRATLGGLTIDVEGNMVPCPFLQDIGYYDRKKLPKFHENFVNTWRMNRHFRDFRKGNLRECPARSYICHRNLKEPDPYGVDAFKAYRVRTLKS
ncbi:radical SAM protein [Dehalococcoidia bacterium]|nr:radical SAM protein [Dehalococcoidia bacterium]